jgi:hypothetical protein
MGPDPVIEADAILELIGRATALRRRLLAIAVGASVLAGLAGVAVFTPSPGWTVSSPYLVIAYLALRSGGVLFVMCAIVTFVLLRRVCEVVARAGEAVWIAEISRRHALQPAVLAEALAMFRSY